MGTLRSSKGVRTETRRYIVRLFIFRLFLLIFGVGLTVGLTYPSNWFHTALNERNEEEFWWYLWFFIVMVCMTAPIRFLESYISALLVMRFRQILSNMLFDIYMTKRAYYHIKQNTEIDNPGQRFGDDIASFADGVFYAFVSVLRHILQLLGFSYVLYSIDMTTVPMLIVYSFCGTIFFLLVFARRLTELQTLLMKDRADFMTNIIRINDASEGIALYNAATHERNWLHMRLDTLIRDSITNSKWQAALFSFLSMFEYLSILIPYWHLSSEYFRREIKFGDLMQSIHAFSVMLNAMNIIVNNISTIASLSATSARVGGAITACYDIHKEHRLNLPTKIKTVVVQKPILSLDSLQCCVPGTDSIFLQSVNLRIEQNESLLIVGPSGCGKSSLLRVMAGLWNDGSGTVTRPHLKRCLFLPQKPYIPNLPIEFNTLRNQLLFPKFIDDQAVLQHNITSTQFNDQLMDDEDDDDSIIEAVSSPKTAGIRDTEILDVLDRVNMTHLGTYSEAGRLSPEHDPGALLYRTADWVNCLSIGEQQRLAIGRCLISKPDMIFVDEATSALDASNQRAMYKALKELDVPVISVGHHWSLAKYHDFVLIFRGDGECETMSSAEYLHIPRTSIQSL